jgi:CheY-like chemotaxis protein
MGGELTVKSTPKKGSTFSFSLVFKKSDVYVPESSDKIEKTGKIIPKGLRILFVDDDPVNLLLGKVILKKFKVKADFAQSGKQALAYFKPGRYYMIFMDINMPDKSGVEVAKCIKRKEKESKKKHKTYIVAMTANALRKQLVHYLRVGMDSVLLKPYSEETFYQKIIRFTEGRIHEGTEAHNIQLSDNNKKERVADLSDLLKFTKGDKEFTLLMLNTFVANSANMINELQSYLKRDDYKLIGKVAHKLIPSVEQMGFKETAGLLKEIENRYLKKKVEAKNPELIKETIDQLLDEVELIKQKISEMA